MLVGRAPRVAAIVAVLACRVTLARSAAARDCHPASGLSACIDADNLWPHAGAGPYFVIGAPSTTPDGAVSVGVVGSVFAHPIGAHVASADPAGSTAYLVDEAFDATLLLAWGVTDRLELTAALPWTVYEEGAGLAAVAPGAPVEPHSLARDLRFGLGFTALRRAPDESGPALAARLEFAAPTGTPGAFTGSATMVLAPSVAFSYRVGRIDLAGEALARVRGDASFGGAVVGTEVGGALGASVDVVRERWLGLGAELFVLGSTSVQGAGAPPLVPAEWIAHASTAHLLAGDLAFVLGGGGTVPLAPHGALTSPLYRLDLAIRYAPTHVRAPTPARAGAMR